MFRGIKFCTTRRFAGGDEFLGLGSARRKMCAGFGERRLQRSEFTPVRFARGRGAEGVVEFGAVVGKRGKFPGPDARGFDVVVSLSVVSAWSGVLVRCGFTAHTWRVGASKKFAGTTLRRQNV